VIRPRCFLVFLLFSTFSIPVNAGFEWGGSGQCTGSGTFQQQINLRSIVTVGSIPVGKQDIYIELRSPKDVDIQLYDKATGAKIVHWPSGILKGSGYQTTNTAGVQVIWSGYNGDGSGLGNEYIRLNGTTSRELEMKAYGYASGYATVNYSWGGTKNCGGPDPEGSGDFQQQIAENAVVEVGELVPGLTDVLIRLESERDVDIQLYDGDKPIVKWNGGILGGPNYGSTVYGNVRIEWSGYNGDGTKDRDKNLAIIKGNEYIRITGTLDRPLVMKAFGYASGYADVTYSWGDCSANFNNSGVSRLCWMFDQYDWFNVPNSQYHFGDDTYADDWNWGSIGEDRGITVRSGSSGKVVIAGTGSIAEYGKQVVVHAGENNNFAIRYTHLDSLFVTSGQQVQVGDRIGTVGITGNVPAHLHLVVYKDVLKSTDGDTVINWLAKGGSPTYGRCCSGSATN